MADLDPSEACHKGWYSRGYLPHFDQPGLVQGITYRLHDSMPAHLRAEWQDLVRNAESDLQRARIEAYLNSGRGACHLRDPRIAAIVLENLHFFDGQHYRLLAWVIMPNHVHTLVEPMPGQTLGNLVEGWKSYTARRANAILGGRGTFWHRDYYDRYIRDDDHFVRAVRHIHNNPVKAGLVNKAEEWPFSSVLLWGDE